MTRGPRELGDKVTVSTVAGASPKAYPLAAVPNNYSYDDVSDQPEAQPNQPLSVPLSFHGGLAYSTYNQRQAGAFINNGMLVHEPNIIRPPIASTTVTLSSNLDPPTYYFETVVNDGGADDGQPVLYALVQVTAEANSVI
ncbi:hypothetical protein LCGC14_0859260, partial [marine sediment metagenome]